MKFRPLHDPVVIRRAEVDGKSKGGKLIPLDVIFLFGKWPGTEVRINGDNLPIVKEADTVDIVQKTGATRKAA